MKKLIFILLTGILFSQETAIIPQLKVEEFTIVGIDTFKARRSIVDVVPGFRSYINIKDPDMVGFIVDKFPVKTFEIKPEVVKERNSFVRASVGLGYGNNVHLRFLAGRKKSMSTSLAGLQMMGVVGGDYGISQLSGFLQISAKKSPGISYLLGTGAFSRFEKTDNDTNMITHKLFIPGLRTRLDVYPPVSGGFILGFDADVNYVFSDTSKTFSYPWIKLNSRIGYETDLPLVALGNLSFEKLGNSAVGLADFSVNFITGRLKTQLGTGVAFTARSSTVPVFNLNLSYPFGSSSKIGLNIDKNVKTADFGTFISNSAMLSYVDSSYENYASAVLSLHINHGEMDISIGSGYVFYNSVPILVRDGRYWKLSSDTSGIGAPYLYFKIFDFKNFSASGSYFIKSYKPVRDTLLMKGTFALSYARPESKYIPSIRAALQLSNFNDDLVLTEGFEFSKSFARHFGALFEIDNPVKEGFEIFTPANYKINNGFSLTLGFFMKF